MIATMQEKNKIQIFSGNSSIRFQMGSTGDGYLEKKYVGVKANSKQATA